MRLASQNGLLDIPYDECTVVKTDDNRIIAKVVGLGAWTLATYSSRQKVEQVMNQLHEAYNISITGQLIQCFNYGYIVEHEEMGKLLYMTDFEFCRYNFKAMRLNHLVIECNYCKELVDKTAENYTHRLKGHCSLDTCKSLVNTNHTAALRTVTVVHLSNEAADPEQILKEIKEAVVWDDALVQIATPGLEINLDLEAFI